MEKNQWEDGYINSYYTVFDPQNRFTNRGHHELYCAGHLMEAAVAYYYATGKDRFLKMMERYADLTNKVFIVEKECNICKSWRDRYDGLDELQIIKKGVKTPFLFCIYLIFFEFFLNLDGDKPVDSVKVLTK